MAFNPVSNPQSKVYCNADKWAQACTRVSEQEQPSDVNKTKTYFFQANGKSLYSESLLLILRGKTFPSSVPSQRLMAQLGESFATKDARDPKNKEFP